MEKKLLMNDHKGGWGDYTRWRLFWGMVIEIWELALALVQGDPEHIIDECADISNFAHMLADNHRNDNPHTEESDDNRGEWNGHRSG